MPGGQTFRPHYLQYQQYWLGRTSRNTVKIGYARVRLGREGLPRSSVLLFFYYFIATIENRAFSKCIVELLYSIRSCNFTKVNCFCCPNNFSDSVSDDSGNFTGKEKNCRSVCRKCSIQPSVAKYHLRNFPLLYSCW